MVAMVFKCFHVFFQVFQKHVSSLSSAFRHMLQLLYFGVSKADRVLHLSSSPSAASSRCVLLPALAGIHTTPRPVPSESEASLPSSLVARVVQTPREHVKQSAACGHPDTDVRPNVRALALPFCYASIAWNLFFVQATCCCPYRFKICAVFKGIWWLVPIAWMKAIF